MARVSYALTQAMAGHFSGEGSGCIFLFGFCTFFVFSQCIFAMG
jgi:hypothetical protein